MDVETIEEVTAPILLHRKTFAASGAARPSALTLTNALTVAGRY
jgi:hypothetical protein